eukprot:CAMPEP_0196664952 /NCGR_PEP_ID=MMETSP1086-20130531/59086_1 /TAXON_ID=77921 /ORGANISM="Cyanoptyche  gloeocystis , Strain SAG4.97" /LENGTH=284 /DNA_ID=CAMNT_0042001479 /DNA_START=99 /DNA_END=954 /DNA_ORIENTATION=-
MTGTKTDKRGRDEEVVGRQRSAARREEGGSLRERQLAGGEGFLDEDKYVLTASGAGYAEGRGEVGGVEGAAHVGYELEWAEHGVLILELSALVATPLQRALDGVGGRDAGEEEQLLAVRISFLTMSIVCATRPTRVPGIAPNPVTPLFFSIAGDVVYTRDHTPCMPLLRAGLVVPFIASTARAAAAISSSTPGADLPKPLSLLFLIASIRRLSDSSMSLSLQTIRMIETEPSKTVFGWALRGKRLELEGPVDAERQNASACATLNGGRSLTFDGAKEKWNAMPI